MCYKTNETTDDKKIDFTPIYQPWIQDLQINWTYTYPRCMICGNQFCGEYTAVKLPDGKIVGYTCGFCSDLYDVEIKRKANNLKE